MTRALTLISFAALAFASSSLMAAGNPQAGKTKAAACFACHGADGNAVDPQYPRLAGQYQGYLEQANVNAINEMVDMMMVMRNYEANQKVLQAHDQRLQKTVNDLGRVR